MVGFSMRGLMSSVPDGASQPAMSQRQVMVIDDDPERRHRWCALLVRHALSVHGVCPAEAATAVRQWAGIVLISDRVVGKDARRLAQQVRAANASTPIILLGAAAPRASHPDPIAQAVLPPDAPDDRVLQEVERWVRAIPRSVELLLVDDEPKWRTILQNYLELKGFTVLTAGSGEEALAQLERATPQACLLDVKMPGLDGMATLQRMRASHPDLPVIFLTQVDEEQTAEEAKVLGAHDYLVKPFISFEQLEVLLRAKLSR